MKALVFAFLISTLLKINSQDVIPVSNPNNITLTYGSCLSTFDEDSDIELVLNSIIRTQPDLWMFVGDAVYLDRQNFFFGVLPGPGYDVADGAYAQSVFNSLKNNPNYVALTNAIPVVGTWDDHDYAYNDADETFEYKERNKGFYLDFIGEPADSPRRNQQGIYDSYYIGEDKLVKVILLDVRYNKDPESLQTSILGADTTSHFDDMLGEEQWTWLDSQLQDPNGVYTLIVSAIQFMPNDRPVLPNWYKNSLDRFIGLINKHQKSGVVLLSGDVHFAEMLQHPCPNIVGYRSFHEFTSSGLTHSAFFLDFIDELFPTYSRETDRYFGKNFGMVRFERPEGSMSPPNLVFEARNAEGNLVLRREVLYSDLVYDAALAASYTGCVLPGPDDELSDLDEVFGKKKGGA